MSRAQMNTNKRRGTAQMHSTPSFTYVADEGWHRATERYSEFLRRHEGQRILFLELGVGYNTPVIIKYPYAKFTTHFKAIPAHAEDSHENTNRAETVH